MERERSREGVTERERERDRDGYLLELLPLLGLLLRRYPLKVYTHLI